MGKREKIAAFALFAQFALKGLNDCKKIYTCAIL